MIVTATQRPLAKAPAAALLRARFVLTDMDDTLTRRGRPLGWFGGYDKLGMARRVMREVHGLHIDAAPEAVAYAGDSVDDAPMFAHFPTSVGVSTIIDFLSDISRPPAWITRGPGGDGFVELADAPLAARTPPSLVPEPRSAGDHHEP